MTAPAPTDDLYGICTDLADAVKTALPAMHTYPHVPDQVVLPACTFVPATPFADYQRRMGRSTVTEWQLLATVVVGKLDDAAAHRLLYAFLSPRSELIAAINATRTDRIGSAAVTAGLRYGRFTFGSGAYLGAQLAVSVDA